MKRKVLAKPTAVSNVFEIMVWDNELQKWVPPEGNNRFRAFGYVRDDVGDLKRAGLYFRTFIEAKVWALNHRIEKQRLLPAPEMRPLTKHSGKLFQELISDWQEKWLPHKNLSTQIRYRSYLKHFQFFENLPVEHIEPSTIDEWISLLKDPNYIKAGHTTRCSYKHEFSVLRVILHYYAERFNRNYRLPFLKDHRKMLKVKEKVSVKKDLTPDEFKRFILALQQVCVEKNCEVIYYVAMMQYLTYSRVQEAAALHYEDFDFARNVIRVNKKIQWLRARGYEDRLVDGSKANGGKEIPLPEPAAKIFREWTLKTGIRSGPLFKDNGELLSYRQIEYRYTQALQRAGLNFSATHILRHASATEFYQETKNLLMTAKMVGHTDLKSTTKYTKVRDEEAAAAQRQMDKKLAHLFG